MMSYLYPEDEVTFDKSGFGPLPDMLESYAEEEANSYFELYFEYPLFGSHERVGGSQVGKRNLVPNSERLISRTNRGSFPIYGINSSELIEGKEYTISFDVRSETATRTERLFLNYKMDMLIPNTPISKEWTRISATFTYQAKKSSGYDLYPHIYPKDDYSGITEVRRLKLEEGSVATDWTSGGYDQIYVNMSDYLIEGNQVTYKPSHSREPHAFRIYKTEKQVERGIILVWARTRTADLRGNPVRKVKSNGASVSSALKALKMASEETHPFSFTTNIQSNISFEKYQTNVLDALAGEEDSILSLTGGQMIRTNNNIYVGINESSKNIVEFRLGKNIEGISYEVDYSNVVTAVIPFYTQTYKLVDDVRDEIVRDSKGKIVKNADGTTKYNRTVGKKRESLDDEVIVYGDTVFSQYANDYTTPFYIFYEIRDDREDPGVDKNPLPPFTKADINNRAVDWFDWEENLGVDEPEVSVKVDVHDISQSSEYSHNVNLSKLETLNVFDKALVYVPEVGIDMDMEINYIRYDGVAEKNIEVRLGNAITSLRETMISPQQRDFNQKVQKLDHEIAKTSLSSDGKARIYWMATKPIGEFEIGDLWFDVSLDGGIYVWDGYDWVAKITSDFGKLVEDSVNAAIDAAEEAKALAISEADNALSQAKADATTKANAIKEQVTGEVNTAITTAEDAKQTAIDGYNNAVAEAERLVGEQTTAFDTKFGEIEASVSDITQLEDNINAKVSKEGLISQFNLSAGNALIQVGTNKLNITPDTTFIQDATIKSAMIYSIDVKKITGIEADFTKMVTKGLTADVISSNMIKADDAMFEKLFANSFATTKLAAQGAWIKDANIASLDAGTIKSGTIDSARIDAEYIVTNGLTTNVIESEHVNATVALVNKIFSDEAYIKALTSKTIFANQIKAIEISASKITTGELDGSKASITNIDAKNITANQASLVQAGFKSSSGGSLELTGDQFLSTASDGSQVYLQNGVMGVRRPSKEGGGTIGQIGYVYDGGSPTYTIQTSWGSHFALKQRFYDSYTKLTKDKRVMYVTTGDDGNTTIQFYAADFVLQGNKNLRFGYDHYINGIGNDLTLTGKASVTIRAKERTIFVVSSNGTNNYASLYSNLNMNGSTVTNTSDIRLKRDIVNNEIDSLSALMKWQHAGFNYINPDMNQERQFSVIAQSAPDLAFAGEDGYLQVSLNKQVNMTSHALQQHVIKTNNKVEQLEAQIATLQKELSLLKGD